MADETFEIGFVVSGQGDASEAFENLKLKEMEARQESAALGAELKRLKQSGAASGEEIDKVARAMIRAKQAAGQYAAEARKVDQAQRAASSSATQVARTTSAQDQAYKSQIESLGRNTRAITALTGSLFALQAQTGPTHDGLQKVSQALGNVVQGASIGAAFGPWGAAIGGVVAALATLNQSLSEEEQRRRAVARAMEEQRGNLDLLVQSMEAEDRIQRLQAGQGSVAEQTQAHEEAQRRLRAEHARVREESERLEQARRRLYNIESRLNVVTAESGPLYTRLQEAHRTTTAEIARGEQAVRAYTVSLETAQAGAIMYAAGLRTAEIAAQTLREELERRQEEQAQAAAAQAAEQQRRQRAQAAAQQRRQDAQREADALLQLQRTMSAAEVQIWQDSRAEMQRLELDYHARSIDSFRQFLDQRRQIVQAETDFYRQELARRADIERLVSLDMAAESTKMQQEEEARKEAARALQSQAEEERTSSIERVRQKLEDEAERIHQIEKEMWGGLTDTVVSAASKMGKFLIEGAEGGGDAFLAMLDAFLEATAIEYAIKALGEAANAVSAAARYDMGAAAAHATAAGLAAGVAAATGLASAAISVPDTGAAQAPSEAQPAPQNEAAGPASYNVSLFAPQAVFTEAERGQLLAHGFREARRQMGAGAVRY